ncbi:hypothetical protein NKI44_18975 [Mesorhizobium sp. M0614]|uniref:hypothetical protein n=1 Tax=Mesorhizobium sp. M0614 TaxID=2956970 RepID=UPI0033386D10
MTKMFKCLTVSILSGIVIAVLCMPANAAGISIGGIGGVSVEAGALAPTFRGSGAPANGNANASTGANSAHATASIGSSGVTPAVGGTSGVANVTLGTARMKKRCIDVINNEGKYDSDLRQLCLQLAQR